MVSAQFDSDSLGRVLVLAPYRRDAGYLAKLLRENEISVDICSETDCMKFALANIPGVLLMTHEAISPTVMDAVSGHLKEQPAWSELPIVILLDRASSTARIKAELALRWPTSRLLYYQRPLTSVEIVSGVQSALLARLRQRDLRDHIDREVELRRELNHRVKNILASVTSIFDMTRRTATSLHGLSSDFHGRLSSLAEVHSAVFRNEGEVVEIHEVVELTFRPYAQERSRIFADGPPITLTREAGTTLALCLHELTTNAVKYGSLSASSGAISFRWAITSDPAPDTLTLEWVESGGPHALEPGKPGYGTRYLRSAFASLMGRPPVFSFLPEGLRVEVRGPLSRAAAFADT